ncbi:MAG: potassium/proton antiporter [Fibromonadaceae bacterium]|jgi:cell volume regulation protein A|nr:potassium/proton antiporter [Fibromonadaceae bacterium]
MSYLLDLFTVSISANIVYLALPLILLTVVISAVHLDKKSVPVILVALFAGIIFGGDGLAFWKFNNMELTNTLANLALVFILFQGGFCTKKDSLKLVALPAIGLASWGVALTAVFSFACMYWVLGWDKTLAILLSVIISSTDAAAIFSILRKQSLGTRLSATIEIESAANDPMAILLTLVAVQALASGGDFSVYSFIAEFLWKFLAAPAFGFFIARFVVKLINRLAPQENGYYYIILLCTALFTYGFTETLNASGMLAVFTAGIVMGNMQFVHKQGVYNFSSAISTIANILLFVLLGVLVQPHSWLSENIFIKGILLFVFLSFVARPAAVFLGTIGMKIPFKNKLFISWSGLRGAVPIVLATYPVAHGLENGMEIFNLVFFAVLLSLIVQGSSLGKVAKLLNLSTPSRPQPPYSLEFFTKNDMEIGEKITVFTVDLPGPEDCKGPLIKNLKLPENTLLLMIARKQRVSTLYRKTQKIISIIKEKFGDEVKELESKAWDIFNKRGRNSIFNSNEEEDVWHVLPPRGDTALCGWDQITVLSKVEDEEAVRQVLLGAFEDENIKENLIRFAEGVSSPDSNA